jgi:hypothetical protein
MAAEKLPTKIVAIDSNQIKLEGSFNFVLQWGSLNSEQLPISKVVLLADLSTAESGKGQQVTLPDSTEQRSKDCELYIQSKKFNAENFTVFAGSGDSIQKMEQLGFDGGCGAVFKTVGYYNWLSLVQNKL